MTLKVSFDEGMTWPEKYWILLDEERGAYSSITSVDEQTIGILYEGSQAHMTFQKISIAEFIKE
ncbi:MAG: sialidase family protein [Bacteroidales bacterium]|nr:sialidase family protein [Bacteroidales bacterium]